MSRFIAFPRWDRRGVYYIEDTQTKRQSSLRTKDKEEANRIVNARNEAEKTPEINRKIAMAYMAATDSKMAARTWQDVFAGYLDRTALAVRGGKDSSTYERTVNSVKDRALDLIREKRAVATTGED